MNYKAILFDMDGVLICSEGLMRKSAALALADFGINAEEDDFLPFTGTGDDNFLAGVAKLYGRDYDVRMKDKCNYYYGLHVMEYAEVPEDLHDTLKSLKKKGVKLAVCTSGDYSRAMNNMKAIRAEELGFDAVITGDDITRKKPDPEIYLKGAKALGMEARDCLVVEDAPNGIVAGHRAGMKAAGITTSFTPESLANEANPEYIINSLNELLAIVGVL